MEVRTAELGGVDVAAGNDVEWVRQIGDHRDRDQSRQTFSVLHRASGFGVILTHEKTAQGGGSPRHRHNFDQVRFILEGSPHYGTRKYEPGTCAYIPEGAFYGPLTREDGDTRAVTFQFQGPRRLPLFLREDVLRARTEMRERGFVFEKGAARRPNGEEVDSFEAVWEYLAGRSLEYPRPCYQEPVVMHSELFPWTPTQRSGISTKHLGYFNQVGPNVTLLRMEPGTSSPGGKTGWLEIRLVIDGEVEYDGKRCPAVSRLAFPPDEPYREITSRSGATVLVWQAAVPGGKSPDLFVV